ncbi:hypothetical protein EIN_252850 [Entamoeba invadens IP1]|uniref:Pre-mRNA-splicing factor CWC15 n=1 Tax=Entamoeba invadens IP1 TaxID=370355 RepID=A0A0A1UEN4_ENTIV|nr:hypothetical protein EIN_252850 [Entamoeba invadens IP1]ELP95041.1 hypothetical protein EIN_252850 [Entamoeba invadens IP1]|eukprot:XP_004261812.1 hypothetical protein EIN_252850 [Entamoeba invadens IP1]
MNSARGSKNPGGINFVKSQQISARSVVKQPELKTRDADNLKAIQIVTDKSRLKPNTHNTTDVKLIKEETHTIKDEEKQEEIKEEIKEEINEEIKEEIESDEIDSEEALRRELEECEEEDGDKSEEIVSEVNPNGMIKRKWYDDVIFKNQGKKDDVKKKRFINDTIRSDYHKDFLDRFVK